MTAVNPEPYVFGAWKITGFDFPDDGRDAMDIHLEIPLRPHAENALRESFGGIDAAGYDVWITMYAAAKKPDQEAE